MLGAFACVGGTAYADCITPANAIEAENCLPGNPSTEWDVSGAGDASIQGFATDMSVDRGQTVQFKVNTGASSYHVDIYRLGFYGGNGARKVATVTPSATLPQSQPACLTDSTGLVDCGNWAVSASWAVPANAVSGIYIARLVRTDTSGASHMIFVVRQDGGTSNLLFQTSDTTWQAYNRYGGNSLYQGTGPGDGLSGVGRAYKVSYNRPLTTRDYAEEAYLFNAEYPMVRWLEQNGYDVSYSSGIDSDRLGSEIARHKVFVSVGDDEYWSRQQRLNVEGARDQQFPGQTAPVHLALFSGNTAFWKTRWEPSISIPSTAHRTLVCYKETHEGANIDPSPEWTGTWRDSRPINNEGANPENALTGTIFTVQCCSYPLEVRASDAQMRLWRDTPNVSELIGNQVWTGPAETIGHEWGEDLDNGVRPAGLVRLSTTTRSVPERVLDHGSTFGPATANHSLVFHKRPSGALVFSAGTIQWSWGLDSHHARGSESPSPDMQQATVNLLADMGVQPATLDPNLVPASASTDVVAAASQLTFPANNAVVTVAVPLTIQGTASDAAPGQVGGVEVSLDGGLTWHPATGRSTWSYVWTPTQSGTYTIRSRAVDDSGNLEVPGAGRTVIVGPAPAVSIFPGSSVPALVNQNDGQAIGLGVRFRASAVGQITAIRFYKGDQDTGTHVGRLWTNGGTVLATATFTGETASGWQEVLLPTPISITPNTTYVATYHSSDGYYVVNENYFTAPVVNGPLTALADGTDGPNGVYRYSPTAFPNQTYLRSNYWVDVTFVADVTPPTVTSVSPTSGASSVLLGTNVTATFSEDLAPSTVNGANVQLRDSAAQLVPATVTWNPATLTALLDPTAALAFSTTYTATIRGGIGGVTDIAGNPVAADVTWLFTTEVEPPPDTEPPALITMTPPNGALDVLVGTNVTATFSEDLALATVNGTNVQLRDASSQLVAASVTWNPATLSVTLDPTADLAFSTTFTATVRGGTGGVTDLAGNPLPADVTWTFTTPANFANASLWVGPVTPAAPDANDGLPIEVGVKFRSSTPGYVTAIRFYKGNQDGGTHVGSLWSRTGTLLATAPFFGETASGWQQATLIPPVAITAGTTYVASNHSSAGYYAATPGFFTQPLVNGPLTALADGTDGPNGVYRYGPSSFPDLTFQQANYWVDVVFNSQAPGPDITPPTVVGTTPFNGATGVLVGANPRANFSELLSPATVNTNTLQVRGPGGVLVPGAVTWVSASAAAVLDPTAGFAYSTTYTGTVKGGAGGVTDAAGNPLASDVTWSFTTQAAPAPQPEEGPGGPILVISHAANPFSRYYVEILQAEGMNAYKALDISAVDAAVLSTYDVAILGQMALTASQVTMLTDWVNAGGNLIAMRPDPQLAGLLGLTVTENTLGEAYLQVNTGSAPGLGIVGETMQFHGIADQYTLAQATAVATLFSNATTATASPAVTLRSVGLGKAAAFTFDLARSIVLTRQGNPAWAGDERDGFPPLRSGDMFYGAKVGDVKPDWVNLDKVAIPQADEQQRLLANLILDMNRDRKPLPRFWYFPFGKKAVVVMTSDNHANGVLGQTRLDRQLSQDPPGCDLSRWECIRSSMYLYLAPFNTSSYQAQGFEIAVHLTTNCGNYTPATIEGFFTQQLNDFGVLPQFTGIARPSTNRTHCIVWSDWATHATTELAHGIRLDTNYYYWPGPWVANRPGYFTGSGMPMRFADLEGSRINVYQAATQITDESDQAQPFTIDTLLNRAIGAEGYFGAITANIHSDSGDETLSDFIVLSAKARGIPVVSARQMLTWLDGRNGSSFQGISWSNNVLTFDIQVGTGATGLEARLPMRAAAATRVLTTLTRGANGVPFTTQMVKGIEYAVFSAEAGTYLATYTPDVAAPVISAVSASVATNGSATVQWLTNEHSTSLVEYGTTPGSLTQSVSAPFFVTNHSLVITGLSENTTYYYRVTSVDPSTNSATSAVNSFQVTVVDSSSAPSVSVIRPNGGERVFAGTPYLLQWTATDNVGVTGVDVAFSSNGGSTFTPIAECTGLVGAVQSCPWTAPGPTTTQGRVRVTARDGAGLTGSATSTANFSVVTGTASLTLTAPTTAVSWRIGNTQNITFSHNFGTGQTVVVDISRDGGATWTTVNPGFVTTSTTSGTVPWIVTGPETGAARARVTWSGNASITSASAVNFAIIDRITITAPNTAVNWTIGSTRSITWSHNIGAAETVDIAVSRDGGATWSPIASGIVNGAATTGTFSWVVTGPATTTARIRVTSVTDPTIASASPVDFAISGAIDVTDPTSSSTWTIGTTRTVTWTHNLGAGQTFNLDLSLDAGATFATSIATAVPGGAADGSYSWVVPGPVTTTARIRVSWSSSPAIADSTGSFDMINPVLTLTSPNTGVSWDVGSTRAITWNHNLGAGPFDIALSTDGGVTYPTSVATAVPGNATNGTYSWVVSGPISTTARIRVSSASPSISAQSAVNFTMANPLTVTITSPNTAVTWGVGSTRSINWNHTLGATGAVDIDVSRDGGATWSPVAAGVVNGGTTTGTFSWVVTGPATTTARIRVTSVADPTVTSASPVNFTVNGTITTTDPTGSSVWSIGSTRAVTWNHNLGAGQTFDIDLSTDNGATFPTSIATAVPGDSADGTYTWVVPGPVTTTARIRVRWSSSTAVSNTTGAFDMANPVIALTSPNTAVTWGIGATRAITWTHNLGAGAFDIALSTDGGVTYPISVATAVPGGATSGTYTWVVSGPVSTTTRIRVTSSADPSASDPSAVNFTMANPVITVTAPNTALNWPIGLTRAITWNQNLGNAEAVNIDRSTDGGVNWTSIATNVPNASTNGTYNWVVSGPPSTTSRIRVSWAANAAVTDLSNVNFTVADPFVTVTAPNTAVNWNVGATQNVTFNHNLGTGMVVNVDLSRDGGATFSPVTTFTTTSATAGSVPWVVTGPATTQARMRVSWTGGAASDISNVDFTIQFVVTLTSPNTAVTWGIGATRAITWTHNLGAGAFDITLSTDGGVTYPISVATAVPGGATSGTYTWVVSGPVSTTTRIRVAWSADTAIRGQSAVNFTMANPVITVTAPNTAVNWPIGLTRAITWNQNLGNAEDVNIDLSIDGGVNWTSIATNVSNGTTNGTFNWLVSGPPSTTSRIRVSWVANAAVTDLSNVDFTVADPLVTVTAPNTAVTWAVASTQNVTFSHNLGTGIVVSVDVSRDGGATFSPVTTFTTTSATAGSVPWVVTGPATTQARMRVSWSGGATDMSDVDFTIQ